MRNHPTPRWLAFCSLALFLALGWGASPGAAAIYKWVDAEGSVHYTDYRPDPSLVQKGTRVEDFIRDQAPPRPQAPAGGQGTPLTLPPAPAPSGTPGAVIFTVPNDRQCRQVRQWMTEKGIPFHEYDVKNQKGARARMTALGNRTEEVPFVVLNGWSITGFTPLEFEKALAGPPE